MRLHSRKRMKLTFSSKVCCVSKFGSREYPQISNSLVDRNLSDKFAFLGVKANPEQGGLIILMRLFEVLSILGIGCFSKVCNAVIRTITVNMIYLICRPSSIGVQERKPMGFVFLTIDSDIDVPLCRNPTSNISSMGAVSPTTYQPSENAIVRIIMKQLTKSFCGQWGRIWLAHVRSLKALLGSDGKGLTPFAVASL